MIATCLAVCASPALAQDYRLQTSAAAELQQMCTADAGQLWGASLCGPLLVVDANTRQVWATERDNLNVLTLTAGGGWVGTLPQGVPLANTTVEWAGVRWIMVIGPLPDDATARRILVAHESWHRLQTSIGFPMQDIVAAHLQTERGRYLLRLEMRALSTAMLSTGRARRNAVKDAVAFRMARLATFSEAAAAESALDRNEGLAAYTGVRLGAGAQSHLYTARALTAADEQQSLARSYAYATGPAYGVLLDEFVPSWRTSLGNWTPSDLLVGPLRIQPLSSRALDRQAERYGGQQIASEERVRAENQRHVIAELQARFTGARLELPLGQMQFEFDPGQVTPVEGLGTVYQRLVVRDAWGELRATEGALISPNFNLLTASAPGPNGLSGPGWTLSLSPAYLVTVPDENGVIRPQRIPAPPEHRRQPDN
ncbi:MAG: hypothetical protein NT015_11535 [Alphaproteobacteria bacterium]|nr:hypothetical protein [Alphaproteobacteria bacterium]